MTRHMSLEEATGLAARAARAAGMSDEAALSLARATVSADAHGKSAIGFGHLLDYLKAAREGRIDGAAEPLITSPAPAAIHCDAGGGIAQVGIRSRLRRSYPPRQDLRDRAVRREGKLHHRRTRLLSAPSGGGRTGRAGRDQRAGADDRRRGETARLLHQSARLRRAGRRGPAAPHRPGLERDRLCRAEALCRARRDAAAGLGGRRRWKADHRSERRVARRASRLRRRARRQCRAHGRGHGGRADGRELGARRALVHFGRIARPARA